MKHRRKKIISFDEETVTKESAEKILSQKRNDTTPDSFTFEFKPNKPAKNKKKSSQKKTSSNTSLDESIRGNELESVQNQNKSYEPKKKKRKQQNAISSASSEAVDNNVVDFTDEQPENEDNENGEEIKKEESIRERKRKKHEKLLQEKKLKAELQLQQKSLNYLSMWKHNNAEWKFEKLRQIWLQQNMYDTAKIPCEFWETLLDYLSKSKGQVRNVLIKDALKIIESEEKVEDNENNDEEIKLKRARDIVQNLQE